MTSGGSPSIRTLLRLSALIPLFVCPASLFSESAPLRLSSIVQTILDRNPDLLSSDAQVREAAASRSAASLARLPSIRANSAFTRSDDPVYVFGTLLRQESFTQQHFAVDYLNNPPARNNVQSSLEMGIPLFTGFRLSGMAEAGEQGYRQSLAQNDLQRQAVRRLAVFATLSILLRQELVSAVEKTLQSARGELDNARRLNEKGLVLGSDYYAAEAIYSGLLGLQAEWRKGLQSDRDRLKVLLAWPSSQPLTVSGRLSDRPYSVPDLEKLLAQTTASHPMMRAARSGISVAESLRRVEQMSLLPQVEAFGAVTTNTQDFSRNPSNHLGGVRMSIPFGDPTWAARTRKSESRISQATSAVASARDTIEMNLRESYSNFERDREMIPIARETLAKAEESLRLFRPLYRSGRQSILEVLRAEESALRARAAYAQRLFQYHASLADVRCASGTLDGPVIGEMDDHLADRP